MEERINAGQAALLAHGTLSAQINTLISITSGQVKAQLESLSTILTTNIEMIVEAANSSVDEYNELCDLLEKKDQEIAQLKLDTSKAHADVRQMQNARKVDEDSIKKILQEHEKNLQRMAQIEKQRDNYKKDADEAGKLRQELHRLKKQVERNKESSTKTSVRANQLEAQHNSLRSKVASVTEAVRECVKLMRYTRNTLMFEGLAPEVSLDIKGRVFHVYRRPGNISEAFRSVNTEDIASRQHMYYFRIETHDGVHFDAMPLENGEVAITSLVKKVPAELKKYLKEQFAQETLYDCERLQMKNDALTDRIRDIEGLLPTMQSIEDGMESLKIAESNYSSSTLGALINQAICNKKAQQVSRVRARR